jgi:hypothetical protein
MEISPCDVEHHGIGDDMKATHYGTCQVCGHQQKLPGGHLAKHGYTIEHGWQEGTCWGSKELPLQISCDLIAKSIERAEMEIQRLIGQIAKLREPATEPKGWILKTVYHGRSKLQLPEEVDIKTDADGRPYYVKQDRYLNRPHTVSAIQLSYTIKTDMDMANYLNGGYATMLERKLPMIRDYIEHQTDVVKNWKPSELVPIK